MADQKSSFGDDAVIITPQTGKSSFGDDAAEQPAAKPAAPPAKNKDFIDRITDPFIEGGTEGVMRMLHAHSLKDVVGGGSKTLRSLGPLIAAPYALANPVSAATMLPGAAAGGLAGHGLGRLLDMAPEYTQGMEDLGGILGGMWSGSRLGSFIEPIQSAVGKLFGTGSTTPSKPPTSFEIAQRQFNQPRSAGPTVPPVQSPAPAPAAAPIAPVQPPEAWAAPRRITVSGFGNTALTNNRTPINPVESRPPLMPHEIPPPLVPPEPWAVVPEPPPAPVRNINVGGFGDTGLVHGNEPIQPVTSKVPLTPKEIKPVRTPKTKAPAPTPPPVTIGGFGDTGLVKGNTPITPVSRVVPETPSTVIPTVEQQAAIKDTPFVSTQNPPAKPPIVTPPPQSGVTIPNVENVDPEYLEGREGLVGRTAQAQAKKAQAIAKTFKQENTEPINITDPDARREWAKKAGYTRPFSDKSGDSTWRHVLREYEKLR